MGKENSEPRGKCVKFVTNNVIDILIFYFTFIPLLVCIAFPFLGVPTSILCLMAPQIQIWGAISIRIRYFCPDI